MPEHLEAKVVSFLFHDICNCLPIQSSEDYGAKVRWRTLNISLISTSKSMLGASLSLSERAENRGPRPGAARSPVSRILNRPVLVSMDTIATSSAQRCTRRE